MDGSKDLRYRAVARKVRPELSLPVMRPPEDLSLGRMPIEYDEASITGAFRRIENWSKLLQSKQVIRSLELIRQAYRELAVREDLVAEFTLQIDSILRDNRAFIRPHDKAFFDLIKRSITPWNVALSMRQAMYGTHVGLQITHVDDENLTIAADKLSVEGIGLTDISENADITAHLDTGGVTADTWYSYWIVCGERGEKVQPRFSLSATDPGMPAGTSRKVRTGWALTDGTSDFYRWINSKGSPWFQWNEDEAVTPRLVLSVATSATSATDVPCSGAAAPTADELRIEAEISSPATADKHLHIRRNGLSNLTDPDFIRTVGKTIAQMGNMECDASQIIEYWTNSTTFAVTISVLAYKDIR